MYELLPWLGLVVLPVVGMCAAGFPDDIRQIVRSGAKLTAEEVAAMERQLEQAPDDMTLRTRLLGYYFRRHRQDDSTPDPAVQHVLWLIRNMPHAEVLSLPYGQLNRFENTDAYEEGKQAWLNQLEGHPDDLQILRNSAACFLLKDSDLAEASLQRGQSLDPDNPDWPFKLAQLYSLRIQPDHQDVSTATKALSLLEQAYELSEPIGQDAILSSLAKTAFSAEQFDKAERYARMMLDAARSHQNWNVGNNIHHGNNVLGRIALANGDIEQARQHLIAAGNTPGSPQLNSFGPNLLLAKELLEHGEADVMLEFLQLCGQFWKHHQDRLDDWATAVQSGQIPDFAANLRYR